MKWLGMLSLLLCTIPALAAAPDVLTMRFPYMHENFDWQMGKFSTIIFPNMMEGLYELDGEMKPQPRLAMTATPSADFRTYTVQLKAGVLWSDGRPLVAQHFVDGLKRVLSPLNLAPNAEFLYLLKGAEDFKRGRLKDFAQVGVAAPAADRLVFTLARPSPRFTELLAHFYTFPIRADLIDKLGSTWNLPGNLVVLGPYNIKELRKGERLVMERNPRYHDGKPPLRQIVIEIQSHEDANVKDFREHKHQFMKLGRLLEAGDLLQTPAFHTEPSVLTQYLMLNHKKYLLSLAPVRQALAHAIDTTKLSALLADKIMTTHSLVHPSIMAGVDSTGLSFDLKLAAKLLADSGVTREQLDGKLAITATDTEENALVVNFVCEEWRKNLGIKVTVNLVGRSSYLNHLQLMDQDIYYDQWFPDYGDVMTYIDGFRSDSPENFMKFKNTEYDRLVHEIDTTMASPARDRAAVRALTILQTDFTAIIPLFFNRFPYLLDTRVQGVSFTPQGRIYLRNARFQ